MSSLVSSPRFLFVVLDLVSGGGWLLVCCSQQSFPLLGLALPGFVAGFRRRSLRRKPTPSRKMSSLRNEQVFIDQLTWDCRTADGPPHGRVARKRSDITDLSRICRVKSGREQAYGRARRRGSTETGANRVGLSKSWKALGQGGSGARWLANISCHWKALAQRGSWARWLAHIASHWKALAHGAR